MKAILKQIILIVATSLVVTGTTLNAADFTNLHDFGYGATNGDGPWAGLILSGGTLYGTTGGGGSYGFGTVFKLNTDGTGFTNLWNFESADGGSPQAGLVLVGNTLYGTTYAGGSDNSGTVFAVNTDGMGFTNLHCFPASRINPSGALTNADGAFPFSRLFCSDNILYGTTAAGGTGASGTIFKIATDGTGFTNLHNFAPAYYNDFTATYTNSDGAGSSAGMVLSGGILYGTTQDGGRGGSGTVFKINADGNGFTNLYHFSAFSFSGSAFTNVEGIWPADLVLSGNMLYGTASGGGNGGSGGLFKIGMDGTSFTNFYNFSVPVSGTNCDGFTPHDLALSGATLLGVTYNGGAGAMGTVFAISTNGTCFKSLHQFAALDMFNPTNFDGANPRAALIISSNKLYGTSLAGGVNGRGTIFALAVPAPRLCVQMEADAGILNWDDPTFFLQAAPTTTGDFTNVPGASSPYTNKFSGSQMFFRLKSD